MRVILPSRLTALTLATLLLAPGPTGAQTAGTATGSIAGKVTDLTGAAAVNVTVTTVSTALMGEASTTTGPDGWYRFAALPPGNYRLSFEATGMRSAEHHVRVALGSVTSLDVMLEVERIQSLVTVVPEPRVLDRHSTTVVTAFNSHQLESLPGSRNLLSVLGASPAVEVPRFEIGGGSGAPGGSYSAYGIRGWNWPLVEGISVSGIFLTGFTLDYGSFDEAAVVTAGQGPEWPSPGVHTQIVTKSGGNTYRGTLYADYEHRGWQAFNIDPEQISLGAAAGGGLTPRDVNRLWSYHDINADGGGFVVRDGLWWYGSMRQQQTSTRLVNFPVKPYATQLENLGGKATYRVTPGHKLVVFAQTGTNHQPNRLDPFARSGSRLSPLTAINESESSTANQHARGLVWKTEWNAVIRGRILIEARVGQFTSDQQWTPRSAAERIEDAETLVVRGGNRHWERSLGRDQFVAVGNYLHDSKIGSHNLRVGVEGHRTLESEAWLEGYPGNVLHLVRNGTSSAIVLFETPSRSEQGLWTYTIHGGDSWRWGDRLTLNLGLRFDRHRVFLPAQEHPVGSPSARRFEAQSNLIARNEVSPRLGAAYDLTGNGDTIVKVTLGTYHLPTAAGPTINPNSAEWWTLRQWSDSNGSGFWEPGEEGTILDRRGGTTTTSVDPDLRSPEITEATAWLQRQLGAGIGLNTGIVWRQWERQALRQDANRPFTAFTVPVLVTDPGPDGIRGTSDDGGALLAYDLPPQLIARPPADVIRNVEATSEYLTLEAGATRRPHQRWSMSLSVSHTWNRDQANAYAGQTVRDNAYPLTPNDLINTGPGGRHEFRTWTAKASGTFELPLGLRLSPYLRHQSGQPFGRTFLATLAYGNVRLLAEPIGTRRMDNTTIVDLRLEKTWGLKEHRRVAVFLDLFNGLNANPVQNAVWSSGTTFLRPIAIVPPRIARIGTKIVW